MIVAGGNQVTGTTTQRVLTPGAARLVCNRANVKFFGHRHSRGGEWPSLGVTCYVRQSHNGDEGSAAGGVERGDDDNDAQAPALAVGVVSVHQRVCVGPLAAIGESETTTSDESECEGGLMFPPAEGETELWDVGMRVSCALIASRGGRRALSGGEFGLVFVDAVLVTEGVRKELYVIGIGLSCGLTGDFCRHPLSRVLCGRVCGCEYVYTSLGQINCVVGGTCDARWCLLATVKIPQRFPIGDFIFAMKAQNLSLSSETNGTGVVLLCPQLEHLSIQVCCIGETSESALSKYRHTAQIASALCNVTVSLDASFGSHPFFSTSVLTASSWSVTHGLFMMGKSRDIKVGIHSAPYSLSPFPWPRKMFEKAQSLAMIFNRLFHSICAVPSFITGVLQKCHDDSLIQRLLSIHSYINGHPSSQEIELCISRVDYMLDCSSKGKCELKHVESNTTSAAFSHFGSLVSDLHRYLCETHLVQLPYRNCVLPPNISHIKIPNSLAHAFRLYQIERPANSAVNTTQTICIIVSTSEQNCYEQRAIEFLLWEIHHISVKRYTLEEVALRGQLIGEKRLLIIDGCVEVAVSYYRIGYSLSSDLEFKAVEMIEQSYAIKCPTLVMLLLGTKKVQERLADPGVLERFLTSPSDQKTCKECFTAFLDVENPQSVQQAIKDPNDWVMKRQRGGGGNNLFGKQMVEALESSAISSYTIQKLIKPKARSTWVMTPTNDLPTLFNAVSELGIFGVLIRNKRTQQEIVNEAAGHLLRTKDISSSDGGVCNGLAVLDSPVLI